MDRSKDQAEKALQSLNLDILSPQELDRWYQDAIQNEPVNELPELLWEDFGGYLKKSFYERAAEGSDDLAVLRTAFFYPDGTTDQAGPVILIEDDH